MSRVVVLGAGISGHTAAAFLRKWLGRDDEVISRFSNPLFHWFTLFVGLNLFQSAFTQWCPMMAVLRKAGVRA
jgi:hypothetical protein